MKYNNIKKKWEKKACKWSEVTFAEAVVTSASRIINIFIDHKK